MQKWFLDYIHAINIGIWISGIISFKNTKSFCYLKSRHKRRDFRFGERSLYSHRSRGGNIIQNNPTVLPGGISGLVKDHYIPTAHAAGYNL